MPTQALHESDKRYAARIDKWRLNDLEYRVNEMSRASEDFTRHPAYAAGIQWAADRIRDYGEEQLADWLEAKKISL